MDAVPRKATTMTVAASSQATKHLVSLPRSQSSSKSVRPYSRMAVSREKVVPGTCNDVQSLYLDCYDWNASVNEAAPRCGTEVHGDHVLYGWIHVLDAQVRLVGHM